MLFNSFAFLVFIVIFFAGWPLLRRGRNSRWIYLTAASFFFYGWWNYWFLLLILGSGFIDYFSALAMVRWPKRRKILLVASIMGNIGSLGVFKYLDFFLDNINVGLNLFGSDCAIPMTNLILPIGISFYTFQSMSYTIDVFKGKLTPTRNVFHFFAYLSMFPQLVAGPIVRAAYLLPQLEEVIPTTEEKRWGGMRLIAYGFFKKVVVADSIAPVIVAAFAKQTPLESCAYWWAVMVLFSFQIYCDFSGYSDISRGLAKWMGYEFPVNFDHPYISRSIREFWSRWHISLSTWFRDYVYIPLGGSRTGAFRAQGNIWITMVVAGFWHGAAWTFIVWGALHAFYLTLERLTNWPRKIERIYGGKHLNVLIISVLVLISWVFFRAESICQAGVILLRLCDFNHLNLAPLRSLVGFKVLFLTGLMIARQGYVYSGIADKKLMKCRPVVMIEAAAVVMLLLASIFLRGPGTAFIYFQF